MAKKRSKASYKAAAEKAARTRAKNKKKRSNAAKKAAETRKLGKNRIHRGVIGGWYDASGNRVPAPKGKGRKASGKKSAAKKGGRRGPIGNNFGNQKCPHCSRIIFGGQKGMSTHKKRHHKGRG